jgi:hypothetical protein
MVLGARARQRTSAKACVVECFVASQAKTKRAAFFIHFLLILRFAK